MKERISPGYFGMCVCRCPGESSFPASQANSWQKEADWIENGGWGCKEWGGKEWREEGDKKAISQTHIY